MAAEARRGRWPVFEADAVLLASALEGARMEFRAVVDMNDLRQPLRRPGKADGPVREPRGLRQHGLCHRQGDARGTWRIQRQREPSYHAGMNIQHECQPRTADAGPRHVVDQHDVDFGVVNLNDLQRSFCPQPRPDQPKAIAGLRSTLTCSHSLSQAPRRNTCSQRLH